MGISETDEFWEQAEHVSFPPDAPAVIVGKFQPQTSPRRYWLIFTALALAISGLVSFLSSVM